MPLMPSDPGLALSSFQMPVLASIAPQFWGPFPAQGTTTVGCITMTVIASMGPYPAANERERAGGLQGELPSTSQKELGINSYLHNNLSLLTQPLPCCRPTWRLFLRAGREHSLSFHVGYGLTGSRRSPNHTAAFITPTPQTSALPAFLPCVVPTTCLLRKLLFPVGLFPVSCLSPLQRPQSSRAEGTQFGRGPGPNLLCSLFW